MDSVGRKILILHRDSLPRKRFEEIFQREGYHLEWASTLPSDEDSSPDLLVLFNLSEEISKIRENLLLQGVPLFFITEKPPDQFVFEGVDLLLPPLPPEGLLLQVKAYQRRMEWERSRNPLTGLPGGEAIEKTLLEWIERRSGWVFYVDLNDFKAYNDCYGFKEGDRVIVILAKMLIGKVRERFPKGSFVGHIGGDDFLFLTREEEGIGDEIAFEFDRRISQFYTERDLKNGYISSLDREGRRQRFSLMTLVLTGHSLADPKISSVEKLSKEIARLKKLAKSKSKALHRSIFLNGKEEGSRDGFSTLEEIILSKENPETLRRAALEALGELDDQDAQSMFLQILKESESPLMRKSAAYGLGRLRDRKVKVHLIEALKDHSPHVRTRAAEALGSLDDEESILPLLSLTGDLNPYVRRATVKSIGNLSRNLQDRASQEKIMTLLVEKLQDRDSGVRSLAAFALGHLGFPEGVQPLLKAYERGDRLLQFSILQALGKIENEKIIPFLVQKIKEGDENLRIESSHSLRLLSASSKVSKYLPVGELVSILKDRCAMVRRSIAHILGNSRDPSCVPSLLELLHDEDLRVRLSALTAIGNLKDPRGLRSLILLTKDKEEGIRMGATWALGEIKNRRALEPLRLCLKDGSEKVRRSAALAIQKILTYEQHWDHEPVLASGQGLHEMNTDKRTIVNGE